VIAVTALAVPSLLTAPDGDAPWAGPGQPSAFPSPGDANTKPSWPLDGNGEPQEDATARSGERYEQGRKLLDEVLAVVPDGFTKPVGKTADGAQLRDHQAEVEGDNTGSAWAYMARAAVRKDGRTGQLLAEVHTDDKGLPPEPCALASTFWGMAGDCEVVTTGKKKVGVVTSPDGDRLDQWAAYRHPDGAVVFVAQGFQTSGRDLALKPLKKLPLSVPQLAALAVDDRFDLD
jgi:hypothetical protein